MSTLEDKIKALETELEEYVSLPLAERLMPTTAALIASTRADLTELRRQAAASSAAAAASGKHSSPSVLSRLVMLTRIYNYIQTICIV
jgi:hypothetical protein